MKGRETAYQRPLLCEMDGGNHSSSSESAGVMNCLAVSLGQEPHRESLAPVAIVLPGYNKNSHYDKYCIRRDDEVAGGRIKSFPRAPHNKY